MSLGPLFAPRPSPGPASPLDSHAESIERVSRRIGRAIEAFCTPGRTFRADELRAHVTAACGATAPGSADRILRDLRQRGLVRYRLLSRKHSLYLVEG